MTSQINTLLKQAVATFSCVKDKFPQHLEQLKCLLDKTQAVDVGLKEHELLKSEQWNVENKAPVTYVDIYEDDLVSVGVFILKPGMKLPLHDHPHMYGLIKVIAGDLKITSYSIKSQFANTLVADKHEPVVVHHSDGCCILEPVKNNLHEIESLNGVAAFLDILAPPYDTDIPGHGPRKCSYFMPIKQISANSLILKQTECPSWFWSDTYPYTGPLIINLKPCLSSEENENNC